jgi:hypothetical protein
MTMLKDVATMSAEERIATFESYYARIRGGEELSTEEYRHAISCISGDRSAAMRLRKQDAAAVRKVNKTTGVPLSIEDLI